MVSLVFSYLLHCLEAVSYTHLDVYKRQVLMLRNMMTHEIIMRRVTNNKSLLHNCGVVKVFEALITLIVAK